MNTKQIVTKWVSLLVLSTSLSLVGGCGKESSSDSKITQTQSSATSSASLQTTNQPTIAQDTKAASPAQPAPTQTPTNPVVKAEEYEEVDPAALSIQCEVSAKSYTVDALGRMSDVDAVVTTFTVAGKPVELVTDKIVEEGTNTYILTKNLGKIKFMKGNSLGYVTMGLTASQIQLIKEMAK